MSQPTQAVQLKPPRIVRYKHSETTPWCIDRLKINGKRKRLFFATKKTAELELERINFKLRREGSRALQLSDSLRIMAMDCADKLAPFGKNLEDATNHYLAILMAAANSITLGELITEYITNRERSACSRVHLIDLNHRLGRLLADVGKDTPVRTITTQRLESWLHGLALAPQSVNNFRNKIFGLFGYAQKRGFVDANPVAAIDLIKIVDAPVEIYTPDELQRLLEAAGPELRPCIAICAFAGTRTAELLKLTWGDIDLLRGRIKIAAHKSKTAQRRLISISENLAEWLREHIGNSTDPVWKDTVVRYHVEMRALHTTSGVQRKDNGLRHSFASYHLALHEDAPKTALQIGHQSPAVLFEHYRELTTPEEAVRYWNIRPPSAPANVVAFGCQEAAYA